MADQMPNGFNLLKQIMSRFMCKTAADIKLRQILEFQANEEKWEISNKNTFVQKLLLSAGHWH